MNVGKLLRWARNQIQPPKAPPPAPPKPAPAAPFSGNTLRIPHPTGMTPHRTVIDYTGADQFSIGRTVIASGFASYEPEVFSLMAALIETSARPVRMLDIGANVGVFSLSMAGLFGDAVRVTAFEPMPELAAFLRAAAAQNNLTIDVKQMALGTEDAQAKFYLSNQTDASNSLNETFREHARVIDVDVRKLDTLLADENHAGGYVLKLDTESTEPDVLAGARAFIAKHRPPIICEVLANRTEEQIDRFFRELNYLAVHITETPTWDGAPTIAGDTTYKFRDWLFLPAPASEELRAAFARWISTVPTWSTALITGSSKPVGVTPLVAGDIAIRNDGINTTVRWGQIAPRFAIQYFDGRSYRRKPVPDSAKFERPLTSFTVSGAIRCLDGSPVVADVEVFAYGEDGEISGQGTQRLTLGSTSSTFSVAVASKQPAVAYRVRWWFEGNGRAAVELSPITVV